MRLPGHPGAARIGAAGVLIVLAGCGTAGGTGPDAPVVELRPPTDTLLAPFRDAAGAVALDDGRWAVVSEGASVVGIVDFARRTVTPLGGERSRHLANPYAVFRALDSLHVADWGLRQVSVWGPTLQFARALPASNLTQGALPRARDAAGRFYVEVRPAPGVDGSGNRDSAAIVRAPADFTRVDSIARLAPADMAEVSTEAGRRFERRVFSGNDVWGVLPDGSVWIARVYQNRVDWIGSDGRVTRGELLPDRVLEVTRADREVFVRSFPPELRRTAEALPYAAIKPPFVAGFTSSDGLVWLEKSRAITDTVGRYHVVGRDGRLIHEIRTPGPSRTLAATSTAALAVEADSAGLRLLQFRLPSAPTAEHGTARPPIARR